MNAINNFLDFYQADKRFKFVANHPVHHIQYNWDTIRLPQIEGENPCIRLVKKIIAFVPRALPSLLYGFGEQWIDPQRALFRQWRDLSLPLVEGQSVYLQIVKKIIYCIFLVLPSLISILVGFVGVAMKVSSTLPSMPELRRRERNAVLDEMLGPREVNNHLEAVPIAASNPFKNSLMGRDTKIHVATFLTGRELLALRLVSREMRSVAEDSTSWQQILKSNRILGPLRYWKKNVGKGLVPQPALPLRQLQEYFDNGRDRKGFLEVLTRNYTGGPVGFRDLPRINIASLEALKAVKPEDMASSVMRSTYQGHEALLIRLIDRAVEDEVPIVLIFAHQPGMGGDLKQIPNEYWKEGKLLMPESNRQHQSYVFDLINGVSFSEHLSVYDSRLRMQVALA